MLGWEVSSPDKVAEPEVNQRQSKRFDWRWFFINVMAKYWKRKIMMRNGQPVTIKKLVKFGKSFAFVLPREYVLYTCSPDEDGHFWVEIKYSSEDSTFTIKGFLQEAKND